MKKSVVVSGTDCVVIEVVEPRDDVNGTEFHAVLLNYIVVFFTLFNTIKQLYQI